MVVLASGLNDIIDFPRHVAPAVMAMLEHPQDPATREEKTSACNNIEF